MRALLEFLGIVEPDRARREPVALPAWFRWAVPLAVLVLAVLTTALLALARALL
ncbi:MAG TPA: hypothetical protein VFC04_09575 [Actinomycetota bacterium]|nr:hypothetical protein [Actinomycetota bacterium]